MIIGQVTFDYHRKGTPYSTLIVLLFWGLETVIYSCLPILYSFFFGFRITTTLSTERYFIYMLLFF